MLRDSRLVAIGVLVEESKLSNKKKNWVNAKETYSYMRGFYFI